MNKTFRNVSQWENVLSMKRHLFTPTFANRANSDHQRLKTKQRWWTIFDCLKLTDCHLNFLTSTVLQESMKVWKMVSQIVLRFLCHSIITFVMYFTVSTLMVFQGISKVVVCFVRHIENKQTVFHLGSKRFETDESKRFSVLGQRNSGLVCIPVYHACLRVTVPLLFLLTTLLRHHHVLKIFISLLSFFFHLFN